MTGELNNVFLFYAWLNSYNFLFIAVKYIKYYISNILVYLSILFYNLLVLSSDPDARFG